MALLIIALFVSSGYEVGTPSAAGTGEVHNATGDWANYVKGIVWALQQRAPQPVTA